MKKKIIHICQASIGGTVEYLRLFIDNIDTNKYENILICPSDGNMKKKLENKVDRLYIVEMCREINLYRDLKNILDIRKILKTENADIIYLHSSKAGALGRIANLNLKGRIFYNPHGWSFTINCSKNKKKFYALLEKILYPFCEKIINISKDEYIQALKFGLSDKKMCIIENGIDILKYRNNDKINFKDRYVVGFVGRLSEQKNPLLLIGIAEEIIEEIPNILFYIVGDGNLRRQLEEQISTKQLENYFYFRGWSEAVEEDIRNFDIALMISKWEGFGLVVCEYMAAKKIVIGIPVGGVKDIIIDGVTGFLVNDYNVKEICKKIKEIKNQQMNQIKESAYLYVKNQYSIKKVIENHNNIFKKDSRGD